jgi:single-strand DNA-binding protein
MKAIVIAGRLGRDSELRRTQSGDPVLSFSVAVDDGYGENKKTLWFDCSVWGKRGESLSKMLSKGTAVAVSGDLSTREHEGKTYLTIRVNDVTLQGGGERQDKPAKQQSMSYGQASGGKASSDGEDFEHDSIPF